MLTKHPFGFNKTPDHGINRAEFSTGLRHLPDANHPKRDGLMSVCADNLGKRFVDNYDAHLGVEENTHDMTYRLTNESVATRASSRVVAW